FSFYVPQGQQEAFRGKVMDWMGRMLETAEGTGIAMCHENEKGIYGDMADRCADLLNAFPALQGIFDPANFVQCGQDTLKAWALLKHRIKYLHIKDALADGRVVPSGCGIGNVEAILRDFRSLGGNAVTVEPHLSVFDGLKDLEQGGLRTQMEYAYPSSDAAFDAACDALRRIL
ncbi:MAG: sugar phosphate isomerase/epimerase, partial [Clostridia bacterium]|nr:sugar phosphate isomerase/epimerase [Clostridia bacterium]